LVNFHFSSLEGASAGAAVCCRLARRRVAIQVQHPVPNSRKLTRIGSRALVAWLSDAIIVSTPYLRAHVEEGLRGRHKRKIAVIPLGIPTRGVMDRAEARTRCGLQDAPFVVATFGRLVSGKGVETAIAATARLARSRGVVHVILGDGPERETLEAAAGQHVRFEGHVSDVARWLAAADVHLLPSDMEGFGLAFVEAALQATPSIGLRVGGVAFVIEDGVTGYLVEPANLEALCAVVARCEADRAKLRDMGLRAQERVWREFTVQAMARSYVDVLVGAGRNAHAKL
jgi:glycosyltransferase involved in cell wall biosynthesis